MSATQQGTVQTAVKIDIGVHGVKFTFEGIDAELAALIMSAHKFEAVSSEYRTYDSSDVVLNSTRVLTFTDAPEPTEPETTI